MWRSFREIRIGGTDELSPIVVALTKKKKKPWGPAVGPEKVSEDGEGSGAQVLGGATEGPGIV